MNVLEQESNLHNLEAVNDAIQFHLFSHIQLYEQELILDHQIGSGLLLRNLIYLFVLCNVLEVLTQEPRNLVLTS